MCLQVTIHSQYDKECEQLIHKQFSQIKVNSALVSSVGRAPVCATFATVAQMTTVK